MTCQDRMRAVLRGEPTDSIPWVPRLDLWYNARKRAGTLPPEYSKASLRDIVDDLGWGYHAVVPHFKDLRDPADDIHRGLGVYNLWSMPYHTKFKNVNIKVEYRGDETIVSYETPVGSIRTGVLYTEAMRKAGISITHIADNAVKGVQDYKTLGYLFENAEVLPNYKGFQEFSDFVGSRGIPVGFISLAGAPMHLLQRELVPPLTFFYDLYDYKDDLLRCAESIGKYYNRIFKVAAESPAEIFLFGANYDTTMTYPPFFQEYITPWLKIFADMLHCRDKYKYLLTHTDGENTGLLECYLASGIDIADSVCPSPMTKLTLKEVRDFFAGKINIMGGIPSVSLLKNTMPDSDFKAFLESFFSDLGSGNHIILGISDTTPPDAELDRLKLIARYVKEFGPVDYANK